MSSFEAEDTTTAYDLLRPTLHALSVAPHISMVFTPTVSHLRAWLTVADRSSFAPAAPLAPFGHPANGSNEGGKVTTGRHGRSGRLVVWNLVRSSCQTSEWSVQGLSETLAALVDCSYRLDCAIHLTEAPEPQTEVYEHGGDGQAGEDEIMRDMGMEEADRADTRQAQDETATVGSVSSAQDDIYHRRLPMLNGSSRRAGLDENAVWSGRTVEVGIVLRRWFVFSSAGV